MSSPSENDGAAVRAQQRFFTRSEFQALFLRATEITVKAARDEYCEGAVPDSVLYYVPGPGKCWVEDDVLFLPRSRVQRAEQVLPLLWNAEGQYREWINIGPLGVLDAAVVLDLTLSDRFTDQVLVGGRRAYECEPFQVRGPGLPWDWSRGERVRLPEARLVDAPLPVTVDDAKRLAGLDSASRVEMLLKLANRVRAGASDDGAIEVLAELAATETLPDMVKPWLRYAMDSKSPRFLPMLSHHARSPDRDVRKLVEVVAGVFEGPRVHAILYEFATADGDPRIRRSALSHLVRLGTLGRWPPVDLLSVTKPEDWRPATRREYERLVARSGGPGAADE